MTWVVCLGILVGTVAAEEVPGTPVEVIAWVEEAWTEAGWDPELDRPYMRAWGDEGWKRRVVGMRALVAAGDRAVGPLVTTLSSGPPDMRVFAAQALGFLGSAVPREPLVAALADSVTAVRLYAVDALGMGGHRDLPALLEPMRTPAEDRDVKKHIGYALLRDGTPVDPSVRRTLLAWDPESIDSAVVGEPAPDFTLTALTGETVRLSDFRGKQAVVLVFIYGDT